MDVLVYLEVFLLGGTVGGLIKYFSPLNQNKLGIKMVVERHRKELNEVKVLTNKVLKYTKHPIKNNKGEIIGVRGTIYYTDGTKEDYRAKKLKILK